MTEQRTLTIHKSEERSLELGGLRFVACRREIEGIDGGLTLEAWGPVGGEDVQVLRFDCFRKHPHYHVPPSDPGELEMPCTGEQAALDWTVSLVAKQAVELVEKGGFHDLAGSLDAVAIARGGDALHTLVTSTPEPSESYEYTVDPKMLGGLANG